MLLTLALVPLGILIYRGIERDRRRRAAAQGGLGLTGSGARRQPGVRGRIPPVLCVAGLAVLAVGMARPQAAVDLPRVEGTVILAFDVSAKAAAKAFVEGQPSGVVIGVVAFSEAGLSVQLPSNDPATVIAAIDRLTPTRGTSLGQGILASLNAVAQAESDTPADYYSNRSPAPTASPAPVAPGSHSSAAIVLFSDGENTAPPDPVTAAHTAADRGVRIDTVGIGSAAGTTLDLDGFKVHTQLDEAALQQIAQITGGTYHAPDDEAGLRSVYQDLGSRLVVKAQDIEITALLAAMGVVLLAAGGVTSFAWLGRLP
jgi:Ca-activated chloride channel family protein